MAMLDDDNDETENGETWFSYQRTAVRMTTSLSPTTTTTTTN
jgi:hypothetical protein